MTRKKPSTPVEPTLEILAVEPMASNVTEQERVYTIPEFQTSVKATSVEDAVRKAKELQS